MTGGPLPSTPGRNGRNSRSGASDLSETGRCCPRGWASARLRGTPAGDVEVVTTPDGLRRVRFLDPDEPAAPCVCLPESGAALHLDRTLRFLTGIFDGGRAGEPVPALDLDGVSGFARLVYHALLGIDAGDVVSYGELAREVGSPRAARAVGRAVGANPLPLVVPCHRVIRSDGSLGGFGGGLERKAALLRLEGLSVDGHEAGSRVQNPPAGLQNPAALSA